MRASFLSIQMACVCSVCLHLLPYHWDNILFYTFLVSPRLVVNDPHFPSFFLAVGNNISLQHPIIIVQNIGHLSLIFLFVVCLFFCFFNVSEKIFPKYLDRSDKYVNIIIF